MRIVSVFMRIIFANKFSCLLSYYGSSYIK